MELTDGVIFTESLARSFCMQILRCGAFECYRFGYVT